MKACVLTIDWKEEKIIGIDFFHGEHCQDESERFVKSMREDWPKPRYHSICTKDKEAVEAFKKSLGFPDD